VNWAHLRLKPPCFNDPLTKRIHSEYRPTTNNGEVAAGKYSVRERTSLFQQQSNSESATPPLPGAANNRDRAEQSQPKQDALPNTCLLGFEDSHVSYSHPMVLVRNKQQHIVYIIYTCVLQQQNKPKYTSLFDAPTHQFHSSTGNVEIKLLLRDTEQLTQI